jgi:hypothetical protein
MQNLGNQDPDDSLVDYTIMPTQVKSGRVNNFLEPKKRSVHAALISVRNRSLTLSKSNVDNRTKQANRIMNSLQKFDQKFASLCQQEKEERIKK